MPYYAFQQNNSGGKFVVDKEKGLAPFVIIQARNAAEANFIAEKKGIYFDGCRVGKDCACCGDRWYEVEESDATSEPELYGMSLKKYLSQDRLFSRVLEADIVIHYKNGNFKFIPNPPKVETAVK